MFESDSWDCFPIFQNILTEKKNNLDEAMLEVLPMNVKNDIVHSIF
jgi:hypothetical protein